MLDLSELLRYAQNAEPEVREFLKEFSRILSETSESSYYETIAVSHLKPEEFQQIAKEFNLRLIKGSSGTCYLSWVKGIE